MRLRNKKTGEIMQLSVKCENGGELKTFDLNTNTDKPITLAELNEEWKDYEEPSKTIWQIKDSGELQDFEEDDFSDGYIESSKSIGNYFYTREEAEKAVEKLKAWKRLKDKGFRFVGVRGIGKVIDFDMPKPYHHVAFDEYNANEDELEFYNDLMLLFGGE